MTKLKKTNQIPFIDAISGEEKKLKGYHAEASDMVVAYRDISGNGWTLSVVCRSDKNGGRMAALAISYADRLSDLRETAGIVADEINRLGLEKTMGDRKVANALLPLKEAGKIVKYM